MAYTAWNVVFGEQPTAAKWNQLGQNDAGFKDGTNIDDSAIITRHLANAAVTSKKIDFTSFKIDSGNLAMNSATINVTGLGFKPRQVQFTFLPSTATNGIYVASGVSTSNNKHFGTAAYTNGSSHRRTMDTANSIIITNATTTFVIGKVTAWNDDGFTISLSDVGGASDVFGWVASP